MEAAAAPPETRRSIGRLQPNGAWIGFDHAGGVYRFIVVREGEALASGADADLLIALAIGYYTEAFGGGPPDLEATPADLSALVRHLIEQASSSRQSALLTVALDAIDDGLPGDAVAGLLQAARSGRGEMNDRAEPADPVELIVARASELMRTG